MNINWAKVFLISGCVSIGVGLGSNLSKLDQKSESVTSETSMDRKMTSKEFAAIELIRLGYNDWVVVCSYAMAKDGKSLAETKKKCSVDFGLPPIEHSK